MRAPLDTVHDIYTYTYACIYIYICTHARTFSCVSVVHTCSLLRAPRQAQPFGHGINIKGRVNIINNLRYNGPSGVGNKLVDMRWGKVVSPSYLSLSLFL